jgi:hypothetical protein
VVQFEDDPVPAEDIFHPVGKDAVLLVPIENCSVIVVVPVTLICEKECVVTNTVRNVSNDFIIFFIGFLFNFQYILRNMR